MYIYNTQYSKVLNIISEFGHLPAFVIYLVCSIGLGTSIINFYIFKIIDKCSIYGLF